MTKTQTSAFKPVLRAIPPAMLLVVMLVVMLLATGAPAAFASTPVDGAVSPLSTPDDALGYVNPGVEEELLQLISGGHVLGFSSDGVIIASRDHMLKTEFVDSRAVAPEVSGDTPGENSAGVVSTFSRVIYHNIWDDVTVEYEANPEAIIKSTYYINAIENGVPVERIRLAYNRPVSIDKNGNLVVVYETGTMAESAPIAWQEIAGQRIPVTATFVIYSDHEVGFSLGNYVPGIPVVIDPSLTWNIFLGGSGNDNSSGIIADSSGNVYVVGSSDAAWGSPIRNYQGNGDAFVAKLNSSGGLVWNTFLGGGGQDGGGNITLDPGGNLYISGVSDATWGSPIRVYQGDRDGFVAKLNNAGGIVWNTFLGGSGRDGAGGIIRDASGSIFISGTSNATWGSPIRGYQGSDDAFVAKLNSSGGLVWNTFLGSTDSDGGYDVALDSNSNIYTCGISWATWGSPIRGYQGNIDNFVAKLNSSGTLIWNTFLGSDGGESCAYIALDASDNVYVAGSSNASWGSPVQTFQGNFDVYVARLNSSGGLIWNTFLGTLGGDNTEGITIDSSGNIYVGGIGLSQYQDAFAAKVNSDGDMVWKINLSDNPAAGGFFGRAIAVDSNRNVYLAGERIAGYTPPVYDAWAAKISDPPDNIPPNVSLYQPTANVFWEAGSTQTIIWEADDNYGGRLNYIIEYSSDGGVTFNAIANLAGQLQGYNTYNWTTPNINSPNCKIRITATDMAGNSGCAISNIFTIAGPTYPTYWRRDIESGDILYDEAARFTSVLVSKVISIGQHAGMYLGSNRTIEARKGHLVDFYDISSWDMPNRDNVYLLRVNCPKSSKTAALMFVHDQLNKSYNLSDLLASNKNSSPNSTDWYCSELVWAAYYNQGLGINIEANPTNSVQPEGWPPDADGKFDNGVLPSEIFNDNDVDKVSWHLELWREPNFFVLVLCPVDLIITDPQGLTISKDLNQIPGALYLQDDFNDDGELDDLIYIPTAKAGVYLIQVIAEPGASPNDTFSLEVSVNGQSIILAENVQVRDIPQEPYRVQVTESGGVFVITGPSSLPPPTGTSRVSPSPPHTSQLPPADIRLHNISVSPGQTQSGQPVTVLANVVNNGASSGSYNVALKINGKVEQQRMVEVSPGSAYPVKFTVTRSEPGTYNVAIDGQSTSFTVVAGGGTSGAPASGGLIALIVMVVMLLATAVVLMVTFRRPA